MTLSVIKNLKLIRWCNLNDFVPQKITF